MTPEELHARLTQIDTLLAVLGGASLLNAELNLRIAELTAQLIAQDNEQTRGKIKGMREVLELAQTLQHEREGIAAALSDLSDAAQ